MLFPCDNGENYLLLKPLQRVVLANAVGGSNARLLRLTLANAVSGTEKRVFVPHALALASHDDVEVHSVNADGGIILDSKVDVLVDSKAEVSTVGKVLLEQLVLLDLHLV